MYPFSNAIAPHTPIPETAQSVTVCRSDRWLIYHRLQELKIPCWCLEDGSLCVEINTSTNALLVRSVVQQIVASRQELVTWLERCWKVRK
jgi:hypothetical protein